MTQNSSEPVPLEDQKSRFIVGSRMYVCLHEAGHIETALLFGAEVRAVSLQSNTKDPHTKIKHLPDLSTKEPVACGGYAVELMLFESGRLLDPSGAPISLTAFDEQAMQNARRDKYPFYLKEPLDQTGGYPRAMFQPSTDETWSPDSDGPFKEYARTKIVPRLRLDLIERLANELNVRGELTAEDIRAIRVDFASV